MKHEYRVGQRVRLTKADWVLERGEIVIVYQLCSDNRILVSRLPKNTKIFRIWGVDRDHIEPVKRGRPAKKIAKPKAEPKVLGYIVEDLNSMMTKEEAINLVNALNKKVYHVFAVVAEYEVVATSELKEVKVEGR